MGRLIIVPQYPTELRYQQWWWTDFPKKLAPWFDKILVLGRIYGESKKQSVERGSNFAPVQTAIKFELLQISEYMHLEIDPENDVLLLNDLSFPGLFASVLYHRKPKRCFAICHATSKNKYDYFGAVREVKYPVEKAIAKLFNCVFVGSKYHADKLKWNNLSVTSLPEPEFEKQPEPDFGRSVKIISVARPGPQKITLPLEDEVERIFGKILRPKSSSWENYYYHLRLAKVMLITSKEETFGYQVVDAYKNGCIPIAPNKCSYPELLPRRYLYDTTQELLELIHFALTGTINAPSNLLTTDRSNNFFNVLGSVMTDME